MWTPLTHCLSMFESSMLSRGEEWWSQLRPGWWARWHPLVGRRRHQGGWLGWLGWVAGKMIGFKVDVIGRQDEKQSKASWIFHFSFALIILIRPSKSLAGHFLCSGIGFFPARFPRSVSEASLVKTTCGSMPRIPWRSPGLPWWKLMVMPVGIQNGVICKKSTRNVFGCSLYTVSCCQNFHQKRILPERTQDEHKLCTSNDHHFDEKNVAPEFSSFFDAFFGEVLVHVWFSTGLSESISTS